MKVGDLVSKTVNSPAFPKRVGIVIKCYNWLDTPLTTGLSAVSVRFFDGKVPETNSYRPRDLEIINERSN